MQRSVGYANRPSYCVSSALPRPKCAASQGVTASLASASNDALNSLARRSRRGPSFGHQPTSACPLPHAAAAAAQNSAGERRSSMGRHAPDKAAFCCFFQEGAVATLVRQRISSQFLWASLRLALHDFFILRSASKHAGFRVVFQNLAPARYAALRAAL